MTCDEIVLEIWRQRRSIELKVQRKFTGGRIYLGEKEIETILDHPEYEGNKFMGMYLYIVKGDEPHLKVTD